MPSTQEDVQKAVRAIQTWLATHPKPGEAVVRQAIILRLLQAAGFDIWNPAEVVPEEPNPSGNRSDFLIRAGLGKFPLEIKGMNVSLQPMHYQQVVAYAANEGTRWAMLTNGQVWVVLDRTHNPAGTFLDHEVLKLELAQEGHTFADDLATLLDAETWRKDAFAGAVATVRQHQQQRRDEQHIQQEKRPIVETLQAKYQIPTFELAAENAVETGRITEAERDVLLGKKPAIPAFSAGKPTAGSVTGGAIHFHCHIKSAEAHALYQPDDGTWIVLAGSTALNRVPGQGGSKAKGIEQRRQNLLAGGQLVVKSEELLEYIRDVKYTSASIAALDIAGTSQNGWVVWKDAEGRAAQHYRPKNQPD